VTSPTPDSCESGRRTGKSNRQEENRWKHIQTSRDGLNNECLIITEILSDCLTHIGQLKGAIPPSDLCSELDGRKWTRQVLVPIVSWCSRKINSENSECITQEVITFWDKITYCRMWQQSLTRHLDTSLWIFVICHRLHMCTRGIDRIEAAYWLHKWNHRCDRNSD
jgi:hypothetical protein